MKESKIYNVVRSSGAGILNNVALLALNLLSRNLFLTYIGIDYLSMAQVINNLLTVVAFSELGLSNAVLYMLYEPVAHGDEAKVRRILYLYRGFNRYVGLAVVVIGLLAMPTLPYFIRTEVPLGMVQLVYLLNLASSASTYFYTYRSILLSAQQRDYVASVISTLVSFARILLQCGIIYLWHDYLIFLLTGILMAALQNAIIYFETGRLYPYIRHLAVDRQLAAYQQEKRSLKRNILALSSVRIAGIVINNTDTIIISWLNTLMVGFCANYTAASNCLQQFMNIVQNVLLHSVGISAAEKSREELYAIFRMVVMLNSYLSELVIVCLLVLWDDFIVLWIGEQYVVSRWIVLSLAVNVGWNMLCSPSWIFRDAAGLFVYVRRMLLYNSCLNLGISIVLGWCIGPAGVYFGTVLANLLTDFWYDSNIVYQKEFGLPNARPFQYHLLRSLLLSLVLGSGLYAFWSGMEVTLWHWFLKMLGTMLFFTLLFYLRWHRSPTFAMVRERFLLLLWAKITRRG